MPWAKVGRFTFDLEKVDLVEEGPKPEAGLSVTITLVSGKSVDLTGEDARVFLDLFALYTASRVFGLPPPGPLPTIGIGEGRLTGDPPDSSVRVEQLGLVH